MAEGIAKLLPNSGYFPLLCKQIYFGVDLVKIYTFSSPTKMKIEFLTCWQKLYFRVSSFKLVLFSYFGGLSVSRQLCSIFKFAIDAPKWWKLRKMRNMKKKSDWGISTIFSIAVCHKSVSSIYKKWAKNSADMNRNASDQSIQR